MANVELTNMVMIYDKEKNMVVVQDRVKSWKGISFPGGHIEDGESIIESCKREIREETGLVIDNLKSCGVIHWHNNETFDRYIVFIYSTETFSGQLLEETEEGRVFWMELDEAKKIKSENGFERYLPMFLNSEYSEAFGLWEGDCEYDFLYS